MGVVYLYKRNESLLSNNQREKNIYNPKWEIIYNLKHQLQINDGLNDSGCVHLYLFVINLIFTGISLIGVIQIAEIIILRKYLFDPMPFVLLAIVCVLYLLCIGIPGFYRLHRARSNRRLLYSKLNTLVTCGSLYDGRIIGKAKDSSFYTNLTYEYTNTTGEKIISNYYTDKIIETNIPTQVMILADQKNLSVLL